jgi:hypothetical protein
LSDKWLVDVVDTSFLVHSYIAVAERMGYKFVQTVTDENFRRQELWQADLQWCGNMVKDFTGA